MEAKEFYLFKCQNGIRQTLGIRDLVFHSPYTFTNVFYEIKNSADEKDLLNRLSLIIKGKVTLAESKSKKITYHIITENLGKVFLRIRLRKDVINGYI
ncbi:hypothetical protein ACTQ3U_06505 [Oscillospiraceae bacterium LCP25S3_F9]